MSAMDKSKFEQLKASGLLPSPKGVALAIMRLTQNESVNGNDIARTIKADPALSGRIIKAANAGSAFMTGRRPIAAVPDALVVLGLQAVRQLALGFSLVSGYREGGCANFDYSGFWSRSLITAIAIQALTTRTKAAAPEETFILGLLSRIGCLALATLYPQAYDRVLLKYKDGAGAELVKLEQEEFAMDHNELTAALLADWGIPKALAEPVYYHSRPETSTYTEGSRAYLLTHSLHVAAYLAELCLTDENQRRTMLPNLFLLGTRLGIESEGMLALSDQIVKEWREWGKVLDVKTHDIVPFTQIASSMPTGDDATDDDADAAGSGGIKLRLLAVDDDRSILALLKKVLSGAGHTVYTASNGREALSMALEHRPQLIITDWIMPEMDGISFCRALRETRVGRGIYVLILTSMEDENRLVEAFEAGVDDFVVKPFSPKALRARLRAGQRVIQLQQEVESDREEIRRFAAELAMTNRRLQQAALVDPLTDIPNRRYAMDRMHQEWAAADRSRHPLACMMIDVDHFKRINDTYGHDTGDAVLRRTAEALKASARAQDVICRIGGEEFLVICPNTDLDAAAQCAERLRSAVATTRVQVGTLSLQTTISVGVAAMDKGMLGPDALIKAADQAVYAAKQAGRNRSCVVRPRQQATLSAAAQG